MEMTISLRPKRRASNENAPGPRKKTAAAIAVANATVGFVASKLEAGTEINVLLRCYAVRSRYRIFIKVARSDVSDRCSRSSLDRDSRFSTCWVSDPGSQRSRRAGLPE